MRGTAPSCKPKFYLLLCRRRKPDARVRSIEGKFPEAFGRASRLRSHHPLHKLRDVDRLYTMGLTQQVQSKVKLSRYRHAGDKKKFIAPTQFWVGLRAGLDTEARVKLLCLCHGSNPHSYVCSQTLYWEQVHFKNVNDRRLNCEQS
jgi:hypothetical protein